MLEPWKLMLRACFKEVNEMSNLCATDITIHGNTNEIALLWHHLQKATSCSAVETGFGDTWLGNILEYTGHKYTDYSCRGHIEYMDRQSYDEIVISQEDAWSPQLMPIVLLTEKYAPGAEILFTAEEPGFGLYDTNDPQYIGLWVVSCWEKEDGMPEELFDNSDYYTTDELKAVLSKCCEAKDIDAMVEEACSKFHSLFINQYVEASVYDYM